MSLIIFAAVSRIIKQFVSCLNFRKLSFVYELPVKLCETDPQNAVLFASNLKICIRLFSRFLTTEYNGAENLPVLECSYLAIPGFTISHLTLRTSREQQEAQFVPLRCFLEYFESCRESGYLILS